MASDNPTFQRDNFPSDSLVAFCNLLEKSRDLQAKVKAAVNPQQVIDIAASTGHEITYVELRVLSRELSAEYFPWAGKGHELRRNFFKQKG